MARRGRPPKKKDKPELGRLKIIVRGSYDKVWVPCTPEMADAYLDLIQAAMESGKERTISFRPHLSAVVRVDSIDAASYHPSKDVASPSDDVEPKETT